MDVSYINVQMVTQIMRKINVYHAMALALEHVIGSL